jgi:hypothetical protein
MIVYHGTSTGRARRICQEGFLPKKPSRRVWFAESHGYALGRAKCQARRAKDSPAVLVCDLNLDQFRARYGKRNVFHRNRIIAINGKVPVQVLRSHPKAFGQPVSPQDLATWANGILGVKSYKGVGWRHPGVNRLSHWVANRLRERPDNRISDRELLSKARQWLPEFFEGVTVDPETLHASREFSAVELAIDTVEIGVDDLLEEALELLESPKARTRKKGLLRLAELGDPDLFEWCSMMSEDPSRDVRVAALRTMLHCEQGDPTAVRLLTDSSDRVIRAAAIAALARHSDADEAAMWLENGLKDPSPCVRLAAVGALEYVDAAEHRGLFEMALYDSHREVARRARKITKGKGFSTSMW